jgi:cytochrome P450
VIESSGCPVLHGYDPLAPDELADPYPSFARARHEAPVFWSPESKCWCITRQDDVLTVLKDHVRFSNRGSLPLPVPPEEVRERLPFYPSSKGVLVTDDPEHRSARRLIQQPFTPRRLRGFEPLIRSRAEELLAASPDRQLEFVGGYATPLAIRVIGAIIGVPDEQLPSLELSVVDAFRITSGSLTDYAEVVAVAERQADYWDFVCNLVNERRQVPREDFTSVLVHTVKDDGTFPTTEEVGVHVHSLLTAGFETSAQAMSFGVRSLLGARDQWELLTSDRSLIGPAVEECLRHRTIVKRLFRTTTTEVELAGVKIPADAVISLVLPSANHDETVYDDPERFDIRRTEDNLALGRWKHFCVGAPLARIEIRITLETLLDKAPDAKLAEGQTFSYRPDMRIDQLRELHLDLGRAPHGHQ